MMIQLHAFIIIHTFGLYESVYPLKHIYSDKVDKMAKNHHHLGNLNQYQQIIKAMKLQWLKEPWDAHILKFMEPL